MRLGRYRFAPPLWGVVLALVTIGLMAGLGLWQIQRGEGKQEMLAQRQAASKSAPKDFASAIDLSDAMPAYGQRYTVSGRMDADRQILFDNQVHDERIGYRVWTPVVLDDGRRVLVDRGWVPLGPQGRSEPPDPSAPQGEVTMTGLWRDLPRPGMRLGDTAACDAQGWPRVLNYPTIEQLRCQYTGPVINGLLLLDEADARGFVRDWNQQLVRMPPVRHFGYALQWFAMAVAVAVIFLVINLRRIR